MAGDSNTDFVHGSTDYNVRIFSFQSDVMNSTEKMNSGVMSSSGNNKEVGSFPARNPDIFCNSSATFNDGTSFGSGHQEWVCGLKHDSRLAVDWTYEEQNMLNEGLIKYAGEGHIMKYIKIGSLLPNKSARDVALRIRWLVKHEIAKRQKLVEQCAWKRVRERKEKMMHSYLSRNAHIVPPNSSSFSPLMDHASRKTKVSIEAATTWDSSTLQLMDETNQILGRIATNLDLLKLHDNINLFCHTRYIILSILSSMSSMSGMMRQMPPLPISVNDDLLFSIFPNTSQSYIRGSHCNCDVKQELSRTNLL